jgi:hypothetical protein
MTRGSTPREYSKPRWWNRRHACLRNKCLRAWGFKSLAGYQFFITEGTDMLVVQQSRKLPHRKGTGVRFPAPPPSSSASVPGRAGGFQTHRMGFKSSLARQLRKRRVIRYPTALLMRGRNSHERSNRSASAKLGWQVRYRLAAPVCRTGSPSETFGVKLPGRPTQ